MSGPTGDPRQVPAYVALARIGAVIGMSTACAIGIFMLVGGWFLWGLLALLVAVPFFAGMRLIERTAEPPETGS